ncbi:MAG: dNTP triphosphohydrolase [Gammaproteobacteria bacterium]|nr:dNTP triphosphohydrolase [Gammaproteobacteria bacterium]
MDLKKLFSQVKRKPKEKSSKASSEVRTPTERDYDRILFSTPVRRLADKTQVFPLERNDSIRTRLTHSHEVANLARSIGVDLAFNSNVFEDLGENAKRNVPAMLGAIGLAHDLGNPPFGHQGEEAIRSWFRDNQDILNADKDDTPLTDAMKQDFLLFEGNAQTIRLLTRLQIIDDEYGLNLTCGTLAALMKYTVPSNKIDDSDNPHVAKKKFGYFQSEAEIVKDVWKKTNLSEGKRHPLTYIMEACDDIAYTVLDAEDAVKKKLVSFHDLIAFLKHHGNGDKLVDQVCTKACEDNDKYRKNLTSLSPSELNDISMQKFRVHAIGAMVSSVSNTFIEHKEQILEGCFPKDLLDASQAVNLKKKLKIFDKENAYLHRSVLEVELKGYNTIRAIMDYLWKSICLNEDKRGPFETYVYERISENYRRAYENESSLPKRYRQLQLMTDMVSGMTDNYAVDFYNEIRSFENAKV